MTPRLLVHCAAPLSSAALVAGLLAAAPAASAAPVFDDAETGMSADTYLDRGYTGDFTECTFTGEMSSSNGELAENGPRVASSAVIDGTIAAPDADGPERVVSAELRSTSRIRSEGDVPRRMEMSAAGSIAVETTTPEGTEPQCTEPYVDVDIDLDSQFSVPTTTLVTFDADIVGIDGHIDVQPLESDPGEDGSRDSDGDAIILDLEYLASRSQVQVELRPGWWDIEIEAGLYRGSTAADAGSLDVTADFSVPGERLAVRGAARELVVLPAARDCEAGAVPARVTRDRADARAIRRVEVSVDGKRVETLRRPRAGQPITFPTPRRGAVDVRAKVVMDPAGKKEATRQRTVSASYESCARPTVR